MKTPDYSSSVLAFSCKQPITNIGAINIKSVIGRTEVILYDEETALMEVYYDNAATLAKFDVGFEVNGNVLCGYMKNRNIFLAAFLTRALVKVFIPRTYANAINIECVASSVFARGIVCGSLNCSAVSGNICLVESDVTHCSISNVSGNIELLGQKTDELNVESKSGKVIIDKIAFHNENPQQANIKVKAISGGIDLDILDCYNNVELNCISGNIKFSAPSNYDFREESSTVSGKITRKYSSTAIGKTCVDNINLLKLSVVSGNIQISK